MVQPGILGFGTLALVRAVTTRCQVSSNTSVLQLLAGDFFPLGFGVFCIRWSPFSFVSLHICPVSDNLRRKSAVPHCWGSATALSACSAIPIQ